MNRIKTAWLFVFLINGFAACMAQQFGVPKDETLLRNRIIEASKKIWSIQCDFEQEKTSYLLKDKAISRGEFFFRKEKNVRLEYREPFPYLILMNNGKLTIKDEDKTREMNLNRSRSFQQLNKIIVDCVNGNMLSSLDFQSKLFESNTLAKIELTPTNKTVRNFISSVSVVLDKTDFSAVRIEMNEPSGDRTMLKFSNKKLNGFIDDEVFRAQ